MKKIIKYTLVTSFLLSINNILNAQNVVFSDPVFKAALVADHIFCNTNEDSEIQVTEAEACTEIYLPNQGITDLSGIDKFINLKKLNFNGNDISNIDLSALTKLQYIYIINSNVGTITLPSSLPNLHTINISDNSLTSVNLSGASHVFNCYLNNNQLDNIVFPVLSAGHTIYRFYCRNNLLTSFYHDAKYVDCGKNPLTNLDYSSARFNEKLTADSCQLTSIQTNTSSTRFKELNCRGNQLTSLSIPSGVQKLDCSYNQIENFSSSNPNFTDLNISHNQLVSLSLDNNNQDNNFSLYASDNANLSCIETNKSISNAQSSWTIPSQATISADCSSTNPCYNVNINTSTSVNNNTITANNTNATYQWMNCSDNSLISSETNGSFTPTQNGDYAVILTEGNCSDTSACVTISTIGFEDIPTSVISIFPNPTNGEVNIISDVKIKNVDLVDVQGKVIITGNEQKIDLQNVVEGVYFLKIETEQGIATRKVIKK